MAGGEGVTSERIKSNVGKIEQLRDRSKGVEYIATKSKRNVIEGKE